MHRPQSFACKLLLMSFFPLGVVTGGQDKPQSQPNEVNIRELRIALRDAQRKRLKLHKLRYDAGNARAHTMFAPMRELTEAELSLAKSLEERLKILQSALVTATEYEKLTMSRVESGVGNPIDVASAKAERLRFEIRYREELEKDKRLKAQPKGSSIGTLRVALRDAFREQLKLRKQRYEAGAAPVRPVFAALDDLTDAELSLAKSHDERAKILQSALTTALRYEKSAVDLVKGGIDLPNVAADAKAERLKVEIRLREELENKNKPKSQPKESSTRESLLLPICSEIRSCRRNVRRFFRVRQDREVLLRFRSNAAPGCRR